MENTMKSLGFASIGVALSVLTGATLADNAAPQPTPMVVEVISQGKTVATITLPNDVGQFVVGDNPAMSATIKLGDGKQITIVGQQLRISRNGDVLTTPSQ
jgi:hypothetical protein